MIPKYSEKEIQKIKDAGAILKGLFSAIEDKITEGITLKELDTFAYDFICDADALPAFLNYRGYPASICASVNEVIIHGIPNERVLSNGDIIGIDIGVLYRGYYADRAYTYAVGEANPLSQKLITVTREALALGIEQARCGNRVGNISHAIQEHAEKNDFSVVRDFVGHGIGKNLHQEPPVPNFGDNDTGPVLDAGMVIAIEPMVNAGTYNVKILKDGWTAITKDRKRSAHFEHTITVTDGDPAILT
ncbi:type I methionyl aminopeptidase [Spirochaetota bacterium]